jgi:hypothetical protein
MGVKLDFMTMFVILHIFLLSIWASVWVFIEFIAFPRFFKISIILTLISWGTFLYFITGIGGVDSVTYNSGKSIPLLYYQW